MPNSINTKNQDIIGNSPQISIIVPVYNTENFLNRCIDSILAQTFKDYELILINDCSTDNSWQILKNYSQKDFRIKLINLPVNLKQGGARNRGLDIAKGKYICFIDSDDWVHPFLLEHVYKKCNEKSLDFCGYNFVHLLNPEDIQIYENGKIVDPKRAIGSLTSDLLQDHWLKDLGNEKGELDHDDKEQLIMHTAGICNNFFSNQIIQKNGLRFPEKMAYEDNYFVKLYCFYVEKYDYIDEPFYYYFVNANSTTQEMDPSHIFDRLLIEEKKLETYKEKNFYKEYQEAIAFDFLRLYYLNSIGLFFNKMRKPSIEKIKEMTKRLHELFPDITKNKYFKTNLQKNEKIKYWLAKTCPSSLKLIYKLI